MIFSVVKYALIGFVLVKAGQFVVDKVQDWRGRSETE